MNVFFHTFGCKANQYDTALVRQAFTDQGAAAVEDPAGADVAILNSCTVTAEGEAKLRGLARRLARRHPHLQTVVMGCAAAVDDGTLAALPGVRAVVAGAEPAEVLRAAGLSVRTIHPGVRRFSRQARAWLKIQDGCDEHCTFCATTIARGVNRSRPMAEIVTEARQLAQHHAEIVLTGVHIGTYGQDRRVGTGMWDDRGSQPRGSERPSPSRGLGRLLEALIAAVPAARFRLSSIEATEVDETIERLLVEAPRHLAAHLHAPLQSGSDRVLKRMGRHWYTAASYRARLERLAARLPVFGLGADLLPGFPGETTADHRATVALVTALPFTYLHVFPYSARPGTASGRLGEVVGAPVVRERAAELRALGAGKGAAYRARHRGRRADGIVAGHRHGRVDVVTEDYLTVYLESGQWDGSPRFEVVIP